MASTPTTFLDVRERHEQNLIDALRDLKAAKRYDLPAISPYETHLQRGMNGLAEILGALRGLPDAEHPEMVFRTDRGFTPKENS